LAKARLPLIASLQTLAIRPAVAARSNETSDARILTPRWRQPVASMTVVPGSGPPAGRAADSAGTTPPAADDHDRIARNITEVADVVVCRLYSTGLMLQVALQLMDGHRAADRIQLSIDELDQVISDLRSAVFSVRRSDPQAMPPRTRTLRAAYHESLAPAPGIFDSGGAGAASRGLPAAPGGARTGGAAGTSAAAETRNDGTPTLKNR
jgi:hypothetical protein